MLSNKEIVCPVNILDNAHKKKGVKNIMYPGENKFKRFKMNSKKDIKISETIKKDLKILKN